MSRSSGRRYTVACLAGDGIGPELMAEASRTLAAVAKLHCFAVDEVHVPFGGDALRRFGHPLPLETREACRLADGVLVAATREPALEAVMAELDLSWRVQRVRVAPAGDLAIVSPLDDGGERLAVERAFDIARSRRARLVSVGVGDRWRRLVDEVWAKHDGVVVEHVLLEEALPLLAYEPARIDVLLTQSSLAEALSGMAAFVQHGPRVVASGRLSDGGPGIFGPTHGSAPEIAGQGVANPSGILLATALLLAEGLGERAAARTIEGAVGEALTTGARTPDMVEAGPAGTTRQFMDVLLAELPGARTDTEFYAEVRAGSAQEVTAE